MTTPINTDKHVFFDDAGNVLSGGKIYIGQPGTDPRTNKKTVTFEDSAGGQFTAQQPLTTINGKISYNGKPIKALVDGEYSMLILDSADKQVDYASSIVPPSGGASGDGGFDELIRVGLTLNEVKQFDVSVGDVVRNAGRDSAQDQKGQEWLAVSNTGNSANDTTLIDFNNGLQGVRVGFSSLYLDEFVGRFKSASPLSPGDFDSEKLGYWEETLDLGGDFDAGAAVKFVRIGDSVTVTAQGSLNHAAGTIADSDTIPTEYVPSAGFTVMSALSGNLQEILVSSSGFIRVTHFDSSFTGTSDTVASRFSIAYNV